MLVTRYDFDSVPIRDAKVDPVTGFLYVRRVPIAQAMVQPYYKADGTRSMEAKLPENILSDATVASANDKPVTNNHPGGLVTKNNAHEYMKGFTTSNAHVEGNMLYNDVAITDADLIKDIQNGKRELSIGFQTEVVPQKGEFNGQRYDAVQKNIRINHLAVVQRGRAGHKVRLLGDSAENVNPAEITVDSSEKKGQEMETTKIRLDGADVTVASSDADKIMKLDADASSLQKQNDALKKENAQLKAQLAKAQGNASDSSKAADQAQAKADAAEDDKKKLQAKFDAFKADGLDKKLALIDEVKKMVKNDSYDYHDKDNKIKSDRDLKTDAIKAVKGDTFDTKGKSDDYVDMLYSIVKDEAEADAKKAKEENKVQGYGGPEKKDDSADDPYYKLNHMWGGVK